MKKESRVLFSAGIALLIAAGCGAATPPEDSGQQDAFLRQRLLMVRDQLEARGIRDPAVLEAMRTVPRDRFVPEAERTSAYADRPLPIGEGQTISQPYVVALMSELAELEPGSRVLEIGTGSGYQAAVLAEILGEGETEGGGVWSIELLPNIAARAEAVLREHGYHAVELRVGDGYLGWPEAAPFDRIVVTAAPPEIPEALLEQLAPGGRLVAPVGEHPWKQRLLVAARSEDGSLTITDHGDVAFVPMVPGKR